MKASVLIRKAPYSGMFYHVIRSRSANKWSIIGESHSGHDPCIAQYKSSYLSNISPFCGHQESKYFLVEYSFRYRYGQYEITNMKAFEMVANIVRCASSGPRRMPQAGNYAIVTFMIFPKPCLFFSFSIHYITLSRAAP